MKHQKTLLYFKFAYNNQSFSYSFLIKQKGALMILFLILGLTTLKIVTLILDSLKLHMLFTI